MIPYALRFGDAVTDRVVSPESGSINDLVPWSVVQWIYPTAFVDGRRLYSNKASAGGFGSQIMFSGTTGGFYGQVDRVTTNATLESTNGLALNQWNFVVTTYEEADGMRVFFGTLTSPPIELTYDITRNVGSGATRTNSGSGVGQIIGNVDQFSFERAMNGLCAYFALVAARLTLNDARVWYVSGRPQAAPRIFFPVLARDGTGRVIDRSGYGNHGVITGAVPSPKNLPLQALSRRRYWDVAVAAGLSIPVAMHQYRRLRA